MIVLVLGVFYWPLAIVVVVLELIIRLCSRCRELALFQLVRITRALHETTQHLDPKPSRSIRSRQTKCSGDLGSISTAITKRRTGRPRKDASSSLDTFETPSSLTAPVTGGIAMADGLTSSLLPDGRGQEP